MGKDMHILHILLYLVPFFAHATGAPTGLNLSLTRSLSVRPKIDIW
jgi:hypothetical protein